MARGFLPKQNFDPVVGWELYQVVIDKFNVMFWFNEGRDLLNVANKFSYKSAGGQVEFVYDIYGSQKLIDIDRILRGKIVSWKVVSREELVLTFENGDFLSIFDNPRFRSWWFMPDPERTSGFCVSDGEYDDLAESHLK